MVQQYLQYRLCHRDSDLKYRKHGYDLNLLRQGAGRFVPELKAGKIAVQSQELFYFSLDSEYGKSSGLIPLCLFGLGDITSLITAPCVNV